jgi:hypothetical protein
MTSYHDPEISIPDDGGGPWANKPAAIINGSTAEVLVILTANRIAALLGQLYSRRQRTPEDP